MASIDLRVVEANRITWFIYLTNWSFLFYVVMLIIQAVLAIKALVKRNRRTHALGAEITDGASLPWYTKMQWVFYNIGSDAALNVTVIFYAYFVSPGDYVHPVDFHTHGINGGMVIVDLFITGHPVRPLHVFHSLLMTVIYLIFSVIYTMAGGTNGVSKNYIYVYFDWKEDPGMATVHALVFCVFSVVIAWVVICGCYVLRQLLHQCLTKETKDDNVECVDVTVSTAEK
ncbi:hypothetical protein CAPTEDRAFT_214827 [Capitella teleta]|uniref:Protein rolling stone-like n=1 Tax=Capitella teleta TaxID=283909 RepID=R7V9T1_CAPTE|nr:hypothetical protein CAPTEDRAFT_214827 [Capitella teleta]|eukprot:ELU12500.1 hypothetical protein CAPTEDRAFT_214827 [Capitella teleta]